MKKLLTWLLGCKYQGHDYQPWRQVMVVNGQLRPSPIQDAVCSRCGSISLYFYNN